MDKEHIKGTSTTDKDMLHTRNVYLSNINSVTEHYYHAAQKIEKEVKNLKFNCNKIIKNPEIAKTVVTDIIHSSQRLETLVPQFEKFVSRFDQGDDIRQTLRSYKFKKEKLIEAVNKTQFMKEFARFQVDKSKTKNDIPKINNKTHQSNSNLINNSIEKNIDAKNQTMQETFTCSRPKHHENFFYIKKNNRDAGEIIKTGERYNLNKTGSSTVRVMNSQVSNRQSLNDINQRTTASVERKSIALTKSLKIPGYK